MPAQENVRLVDLTDEELLARYYDSDDEAFGEFDRRHRPNLIGRAFGRLSSYQGKLVGKWRKIWRAMLCWI